ncbi:hypothetical protein PVAND_005819 [Polypedilum vanderplanki]|uniref:Sugar transporter n=1 Tax=Polypedilum vanderplanki TaxID=319348 RepID=A0A9J6C2C6_POLVA|nr:hypothetical protein PVAND_005819 [Polypedilum vanderplanki]
MLSKICSGRKANISNNNDLSKRAILMQIFISFLANLSVLSPKMGLGFPAILSLLMIKDEKLTEEQFSWFASITAIACPIGGVLAAFCCDKIGRKATIIVTDIISIIQWAMIAFSNESDSKLLFAELIIARVLTGISIGMCNTICSLFIRDLPSKNLWKFTHTEHFYACCGHIHNLYNREFHSASIYALSIIIFSTIACFFVPETPVYLVTKNKLYEARKALSMLHNVYKYDSKIDDEIRQIQEIRLSSSTNDESKSSAFMVIQQISGIHVIYIFAAQFVQEADVTIDEFVATAIIGIIRCVGTLLVGFISDITGRKSIAIVSTLFIFWHSRNYILLAIDSFAFHFLSDWNCWSSYSIIYNGWRSFSTKNQRTWSQNFTVICILFKLFHY